jgi:predicted ATPase
MSLRIHARNFRALRTLDWTIPEGVSVLTGANGSGKTTCLLVLRFLKLAIERGWPSAVDFLGGANGLRTHGAPRDEAVEVGIDVDDLSWRLHLTPQGASVTAREELLKSGVSKPLYTSDVGDGELLLEALRRDEPSDVNVGKVFEALSRIAVFYDADLSGLREAGSRITDVRTVQTQGKNVLAVLRSWRDKKTTKGRFDFVMEGMNAAFPELFESMDFEVAGQTVSASIYRRGVEEATPLIFEANGILSLLITLTEVASAEPGSLFAIDEPEVGLHPYAIRQMMESLHHRAETIGCRIVVTTHSPVLLNTFDATPERILVLAPKEDASPKPLSELRTPEWLASFALGALYADGEFAANG